MRVRSLSLARVALVFLLAGCLGSPQAAETDDVKPSSAARAPAGGVAGVPVPGPLTDVSSLLPRDVVCRSILHEVDLQSATISDLRRGMDAGELTSIDLVDAYVARFLALDEAGPSVNSIQTISGTARERAEALDAERAAGNVRGPLHGIPILLKDNVGTSDMPTTAGSIALADNVPPRDATLTARLRDAGAIILGKTQLSEFANWMSTSMPNGYSSLGGQVINAYTGGDPSGSSSGSGVAGSMAFAAATIGTETSGSILSPSNANSLVGVKPTLGLVSRAGVIPLAVNFDTPGPMTRNVYDAAAVLSAIAGPDPLDPATGASGEHLPEGGDYTRALSTDALQGARLGYVPRPGNELFVRALEDLERLGAVLVPIDESPVRIVSITELPLIFNEFKFGINRYLAEEAGPGLPVSDLTGIILFNQEHPDKVKYGQDLLIASDATPGNGVVADAAAVPTVTSSRAVADDLFSRDELDALIGPNAPYTGLGAAAGYPTVTVPSGYNGREPQGLSFFGPAWSEGRLLSYAYDYEDGSMRREPPTEINPGLLEGVCGVVDGSTEGAAVIRGVTR